MNSNFRLSQILGKTMACAAACLMLSGFSFAADTVTFAKDIAPILQAKCQECHHAGSMAPMSLVTYEEARPWAKAIKEETESRRMPPFGAAYPAPCNAQAVQPENGFGIARAKGR